MYKTEKNAMQKKIFQHYKFEVKKMIYIDDLNVKSVPAE